MRIDSAPRRLNSARQGQSDSSGWILLQSRLVAGLTGSPGAIRIGTSGFSYKEWPGSLYPPETAGTQNARDTRGCGTFPQPAGMIHFVRMIPPLGEYRYEIRGRGEIAAIEETRLDPERLSGSRISDRGGNRYEVEARLAPDGYVQALEVRYRRGPFERNARYQAEGEVLRGIVGALAARNPAEAKLGRLREVDAELVLFKALIIAHIRARGQTGFTGRVVTIDPNTLIAASLKQTYRQRDAAGVEWIFEPLDG